MLNILITIIEEDTLPFMRRVFWDLILVSFFMAKFFKQGLFLPLFKLFNPFTGDYLIINLSLFIAPTIPLMSLLLLICFTIFELSKLSSKLCIIQIPSTFFYNIPSEFIVTHLQMFPFKFNQIINYKHIYLTLFNILYFNFSIIFYIINPINPYCPLNLKFSSLVLFISICLQIFIFMSFHKGVLSLNLYNSLSRVSVSNLSPFLVIFVIVRIIGLLFIIILVPYILFIHGSVEGVKILDLIPSYLSGSENISYTSLICNDYFKILLGNKIGEVDYNYLFTPLDSSNYTQDYNLFSSNFFKDFFSYTFILSKFTFLLDYFPVLIFFFFFIFRFLIIKVPYTINVDVNTRKNIPLNDDRDFHSKFFSLYQQNYFSYNSNK